MIDPIKKRPTRIKWRESIVKIYSPSLDLLSTVNKAETNKLSSWRRLLLAANRAVSQIRDSLMQLEGLTRQLNTLPK